MTREQKWGNLAKISRELLVDAQREIENLNSNIMNMGEKLIKLQKVEIKNHKHKNKLVNLYDMEIIDYNGEEKWIYASLLKLDNIKMLFKSLIIFNLVFGLHCKYIWLESRVPNLSS